MDIKPEDAGGLERHPQPDVMEASVDNPPPKPDAPGPPIARDESLPPSQIIPSPPIPSDKADILPPLRLCQKEYVLQRPHPTEDLLALYGLSLLAASVARNDPVTGEKINKMRRSYEGQVKTFGLAGRNKAVKFEDGTPGGLMELVGWPDEEWNIQKVVGKESNKGLSEAILGKLEEAMKLEPGSVPKNDEWENVLGLEKLKPPMPVVDGKTKTSVPSSSKIPKANGAPNGITVGTPGAGEVARPKRTGRKRRYDEHSFEGYGEGYGDDDGDIIDAGGYSSGEGSRKSSVSKKKRKRDYTAISPPAAPERAGSYGVGMMRVPTGIGTYGR